MVYEVEDSYEIHAHFGGWLSPDGGRYSDAHAHTLADALRLLGKPDTFALEVVTISRGDESMFIDGFDEHLVQFVSDCFINPAKVVQQYTII